MQGDYWLSNIQMTMQFGMCGHGWCCLWAVRVHVLCACVVVEHILVWHRTRAHGFANVRFTRSQRRTAIAIHGNWSLAGSRQFRDNDRRTYIAYE